jgi:hypothetical protein
MSYVSTTLSPLLRKRSRRTIDKLKACVEKRRAIEGGEPGSLEDAKQAEAEALYRDQAEHARMDIFMGEGHDGLKIPEDTHSGGEFSRMDWSDVLPDLTEPLARPDFWPDQPRASRRIRGMAPA